MHLSCKRLQWLHIKKFIRETKGPLAALLSGCGALILFWYFRGNKAVMDWFIHWVSTPWKTFWGGVTEWAAFSMAELLCSLFGLWLVYAIIDTIRRQMRCQRVMGRRLVALAALIVWVYAGICAFWGVHYYGTSFGEKSGLVAQPVSVQQLAATTRWFAQGASRTANDVKRSENGRYLGSNADILAYGDACYSQLVQEYSFLNGPTRSPKPAVYSWFMSAAGFTGYIFPYLGETVLNVHSPNVYLPVTVAHELAHQRGVAPEQEANFVGIAACITADSPDYQYSGWLFGYSHLSSALYSVDQQAWQEIWDSLAPECQIDLQWNNEYWAAFQTPVTTLFQTTYSGFLQSYGQQLGLASYGACVDLLVAKYGPQAME